MSAPEATAQVDGLDGFSFRIGPPDRHSSKRSVSCLSGTKTFHTDRLDISSAKQRTKYLDKVCEKFPGARAQREQLADLLQRQAAESDERRAKEQQAKKPGDGDESLYRELDGMLYRVSGSGDGDPVKLANFTARIVERVYHDDGAEVTQRVTIEGRTYSGKPLKQVTVTVEDFHSLRFIKQEWGSAIIQAGAINHDHVRCAIQEFSGEVPECIAYAHTGWREMPDGTWRFLVVGGSIGADGFHPSPAAELLAGLEAFKMAKPPDGDDKRRALDAELRLLGGDRIAPDRVMTPLVGAVFAAVLGEVDFTIHVYGPSGARKTALGVLVQQHFAPKLRTPLASGWGSTANANEQIGFNLKDYVQLLDDLVAVGSRNDVARSATEADRTVRNRANRTGRGRLNRDGTLRPVKVPRSLALSTGEHEIEGRSAEARTLSVAIGGADVNLSALSHAQAAAADGLYAQATAAFIAWVARNGFVATKAELERRKTSYRDQLLALHRDWHARASSVVASPAAALSLFIDCVVDAGVLTRSEAADILQRCWNGLVEAADAQSADGGQSRPERRCLSLIASAISSGRGHITSEKGGNEPPEHPEAWGWRKYPTAVGNGSDWRPDGRCIGAVIGGMLYLDVVATLAVVKQLAHEQGEPFHATDRMLGRHLREARLLAAVDQRNRTNHVWTEWGGAMHRSWALQPESVVDPEGLRETRDQRETPGKNPAAGSAMSQGLAGNAGLECVCRESQREEETAMTSPALPNAPSSCPPTPLQVEADPAFPAGSPPTLTNTVLQPLGNAKNESRARGLFFRKRTVAPPKPTSPDEIGVIEP